MALAENPCTISTPSAGRFAADRHFLNHSGGGFASNDTAEYVTVRAETSAGHQGHFAIFRASRVGVTSILSAGGDWRWRLSDNGGAILVEAGGYSSEADCREAVATLQARSARATVG